MTTNNYNNDLPDVEELERLANSFFDEFDERICADGIERLVTTGDTTVISNAFGKAQGFGGGLLSEIDYLNILNSVTSSEQTGGGHSTAYSPTVVSQADRTNA